jgi:hypothetical protein
MSVVYIKRSRVETGVSHYYTYILGHTDNGDAFIVNVIRPRNDIPKIGDKKYEITQELSIICISCLLTSGYVQKASFDDIIYFKKEQIF